MTGLVDLIASFDAHPATSGTRTTRSGTVAWFNEPDLVWEPASVAVLTAPEPSQATGSTATRDDPSAALDVLAALPLYTGSHPP